MARAILLRAVPHWARDAARGDLDEEYARIVTVRGRGVAARWYLREALLLGAHYATEWGRGAPGRPPRSRRAMTPLTLLRDLARDIRLALRQAALAPGFWMAATLTLGLAIGFNAAIFSLVNAVLFKPLARDQPDRVVRLYTRTDSQPPKASFSYLDLTTLKGGATSVTSVSAVHLATFVMADRNMSHQLLGEIASGTYFELLGVPVIAGRTIGVEDDHRASEPVALLSEHVWRNRLGADPSIVGRSVMMSGRPFTIAGIVSSRFGGSFVGGGVDVWLPLEPGLPLLGSGAGVDGAALPLQILARLADGVSAEQADAALAPLAGEIARNRAERRTVRLQTGPGTLLHGPARRMAALFLAILTAMVGLVLFIAASNVANLLLARTLGRRREMAIRMSLGAGRLRIAQQLAAESLVLAAGGFVIAVAIAWWISRSFQSVELLPGFDLRLDLAPDARVFAVTGAIALIAGLVATLMPAVSAARGDLVPFLREGGASLGSRRTARVRAALVIAQVAIAVVVCVAAALLAKSGRAAAAIDLGFDRNGIFATDVDLDVQGYAQARGESFYRELISRVEQIPGVEHAVIASRAPLDSSTPGTRLLRDGEVAVEGQSAEAGFEASYYVVSPHYLDTVGVPLVAGRAIADTDRAESPQVAVANEFLVQAMWPGLPVSQAVGRRVRGATTSMTGAGLRGEIEIIGVARNAKYRTVGELDQPHLYVPYAQHYSGSMALLVRARTRPLPVQDVQAVMAALDPAVQGFFTRTLDEHTRVALLPAIFASRVAALVGVVSALLGAIGLHALIACVVAERRREFGLRMALGATAGSVSGGVVRQAVRLSVAGCVAGVIAALLAGRLLGSLLYGVSPSDPLVYLAVVAASIAVAAVSAWLPARRAARVAPTVALRA